MICLLDKFLGSQHKENNQVSEPGSGILPPSKHIQIVLAFVVVCTARKQVVRFLAEEAWQGPGPRGVSLTQPTSSPAQVSFQHETYPGSPSEKPPPELEEQPLARQVFIVQELEIRDRLASSQINKFLYLYSSECMPRRTHSNMVWGWRAWEAGGKETRLPASWEGRNL